MINHNLGWCNSVDKKRCTWYDVCIISARSVKLNVYEIILPLQAGETPWIPDFAIQGHISQTIFSKHNSNSMKISFYAHPLCNAVIAMKFCTWHDSCAIVACAKFCNDTKPIYGVTLKPNCPRIWIMMENLLAKWPRFQYGVDGLLQERRNSSAYALELRLPCTNSSVCWLNL